MFFYEFQVILGVFLQVYHLSFLYVAMLHLDVSKVDLMLHMLLWLYTYVSEACFKCLICFRRMLQMFHLDVLKVYLRKAHTAASVPS
jgi:hypothetical protein